MFSATAITVMNHNNNIVSSVDNHTWMEMSLEPDIGVILNRLFSHAARLGGSHLIWHHVATCVTLHLFVLWSHPFECNRECIAH